MDIPNAILKSLTDDEYASLYYNWEAWARPNQLPPDGAWTTWLILAGRGWGKTRCGAEWVRMRVEQGARRIALIAETSADARDVMIEGESGILSVCPPWDMPIYEPSKRRLTWPNGAIASSYSGDKPDQLRGPQHDAVWADEPAKWRYVDEAWSNLMLGLRLGENPQVVATTTPRPIRLLRDMLKDPMAVVTKGNTFENIDNLAPTFRDAVLARYKDTRLGRQEIYAEILDDAVGALWDRELIEANRRTRPPNREEMKRIVVAIDPAVTSGEDADETGIIVAGVTYEGIAHVLADVSGRYKPQEWANKAIAVLSEWDGDRIVAEVNNGGEMVEQTLRTIAPHVPYNAIRAGTSKYTRAEPVSALYEQQRVFHCGNFNALEDQMVSYEQGTTAWSPDRMDAMVYAITELILETPREVTIKKVLG